MQLHTPSHGSQHLKAPSLVSLRIPQELKDAVSHDVHDFLVRCGAPVRDARLGVGNCDGEIQEEILQELPEVTTLVISCCFTEHMHRLLTLGRASGDFCPSLTLFKGLCPIGGRDALIGFLRSRLHQTSPFRAEITVARDVSGNDDFEYLRHHSELKQWLLHDESQDLKSVSWANQTSTEDEGGKRFTSGF